MTQIPISNRKTRNIYHPIALLSDKSSIFAEDLHKRQRIWWQKHIAQHSEHIKWRLRLFYVKMGTSSLAVWEEKCIFVSWKHFKRLKWEAYGTDNNI